MPKKPKKSTAPLPQPIFEEPFFAEGQASPDPNGFRTPHPSDKALYQQLNNLLKTAVVSFNQSRAKPGDLYTLQEAVGKVHGPELISGIQRAGQIVFHAIGDSGASNAGRYPDEITVSDQLVNDFHTADPESRPAFLYHLGDVVYDFGESQYYYDQFYEPYRNYPAPIFAIPGNHDSFVVPGTRPDETPLDIFERNFCSETAAITPEAKSLHRTAMTQPGVYFALDAPFVRIIGLFSNALEDPGVISNKDAKGKWAKVPGYQLDFLTAQLQRIKQESYPGAVLLAVHHPPFSYSPPAKKGAGGNHGCSSDMLRQIDTICKTVGVYPHAFLSGHAHNYQRYSRSVRFAGKELEVPFVICGDGGHNVISLVHAKGGPNGGVGPHEPSPGDDVGYLESNPAVDARGLILKRFDDREFGYLRILVDKQKLQIAFHSVGTASLPQSRVDMVTIDLASHTMLPN